MLSESSIQTNNQTSLPRIKRIAIIDDNEALNKLIQVKLKRSGYEPLEFLNGVLGFNYILKHPVDMIVLDIMLGGMSGWEVLNEMNQHEQTKHIPVIVLSIRSREQDMNRAFKSMNVVEYIAKPFKLSHLIHVIGTHFENL